MTISAASGLRARPGELTNEELRNYVASPLAACSTASLDPDEWFPIAAGTARARAEASHALAVCAICPIQAECLEMSLRQWSSVGNTASGAAWSRPNARCCAGSGAAGFRWRNCFPGRRPPGYPERRPYCRAGPGSYRWPGI